VSDPPNRGRLRAVFSLACTRLTQLCDDRSIRFSDRFRTREQNGAGQETGAASASVVKRAKTTTHKASDETIVADAIAGQPNPVQSESISCDDRTEIDRKMMGWTAVVARWTRLLAIVTVVIGGIGIGATIWVGHQGDETQRAAQRPWMKYEGLEIIEPLTYADGVIKTKVRFHLRNSGNSPALKVIPRAALVMNELTTDAAQRKLCEPLKEEPKQGEDQGFTSFPGEEPVKEEEPISVPFPKFLGSPPVIFLTIVSCLTYRFSFGMGEVHQTGIIFNVISKKLPSSTPAGGEAGVIELAIDPKLGSLQPSDIRLAVWHLGSYAY
jgi:hypothetical protein